MQQLSNPKERKTIGKFLDYVSTAYTIHWLFHASAAIFLFQINKAISAYSGIISFIYLFFASKAFKHKKILMEEASFDSTNLKKWMNFVFVVNLIAFAISCTEGVLFGTWFWNFGDDTYRTILYLNRRRALERISRFLHLGPPFMGIIKVLSHRTQHLVNNLILRQRLWLAIAIRRMLSSVGIRRPLNQ